MKKWMIGGAALVVLVAGAWWLSVPDEPPGPAEVFDMANAPFYLQDAGMPGEPVSLSDGVYEGDGFRIDVVEGPVFSDLDGDGELDAAAILESSGTSDWRGVFAWVRDGDGFVPVEWMLSWQYDCATGREIHSPPVENLVVAGMAQRPDGRMTEFGVGFWRAIDNRCEALNLSRSAELWGADAFLYEGVPVTVRSTYSLEEPDVPVDEPFSAATTECTRARSVGSTAYARENFRPVAEGAPLLLVPEDGAPAAVGPSDVEAAYVWAEEEPDPELLKARNGYVPADVYWQGQTYPTCAWVEWDRVEQP